jgi:hypothetical protein
VVRWRDERASSAKTQDPVPSGAKSLRCQDMRFGGFCPGVRINY